jgi:CheY-like chemotaxis protein
MASVHPSPRSPAPDRPRRLLFADDDEWILESSVALLEDMGFEVVAVTDGAAAREAFEQARVDGKAFDVAVLDVRMPRLNGPDIVPDLLAADPALLILVSSGYARHQLDAGVFMSPRVGFVAKPADPDAIRAELRILAEAVALAGSAP